MSVWRAVAACLLAILVVGGVPAGPSPAVAAKATGTGARAAEAAKRRQLCDALLTDLWMGQAGGLTGETGAERDWAMADRRQVWATRLFDALGAGREGTATRPAPHAPPRGGDRPGLPRAAMPMDEDDALAPQAFEAPENGLSWPVPGRLAASFAPSARPPRQGVLLAASEGEPVAAAADGRVVFVGGLRGLGHIVILDHGARRHTVYGCLGQVSVHEGDRLARGEALGQAGICGLAKASGVYFELRFREKALNPAEWLAVRR